MARSRPRWQMTTRSRFAVVLGLAGLAVAGVQLAMLSDPPTVLQLVVTAFWSMVGVAYLVSAVAQHRRSRRPPAPAPSVPTALDEIVPVPVRPARPRPRTGETTAARPGGGTPAPGARPAASETRRVAIRSRRPEPTGARDAPEAVTAVAAAPAPAPDRAEPAAPAAPGSSVPPGPPAPAVPAMALVPSVAPARAPAATSPGRARPAPPPVLEETTDAFTVRTPPPADPEPPRGRHASGTHSRGDGFGSALSFGPARGTTVAVAPGRPESRPPRPTPPGGLPRADAAPPPPPPRPAAASLTPSVSLAAAPPPSGERPVTPRRRGAHAAAAPAAAESVPAPRARHRADVEDPVAARRGGAARARGRHASNEAPPVAARGGR